MNFFALSCNEQVAMDGCNGQFYLNTYSSGIICDLHMCLVHNKHRCLCAWNFVYEALIGIMEGVSKWLRIQTSCLLQLEVISSGHAPPLIVGDKFWASSTYEGNSLLWVWVQLFSNGMITFQIHTIKIWPNLYVLKLRFESKLASCINQVIT